MHSPSLKFLAPLFAGLAVLAVPDPAKATVADDLCAPIDDPCVFSGTIDIDDLSLLDFGTRALVIDGTVRGGEGEMTILAGSLTISSSGVLRARGDNGGIITVTTLGDIVINGTALQGAIQLRGDFAGGDLVLVSTGGTITGSGKINIEGGEVGGRAELTATSINLTGLLDGTGSVFDTGGVFEVVSTTGPIHLGDIDVSGGDAGELQVTSAAGVTLGTVKARGTGDSGSGPFLFTFFVHSVGPIVVEGEVDAIGGVDGDGGELDLTAGALGARDDITISGPIRLYSRGNFGTFGELTMVGAAVQIADRIDVSGGAAGVGSDALAGDVTVHATESLEVTATGEILVKAGADGMAGTVTFTSDGSISLLGPIEADAGDSGGQVDLRAAGPIDIDAAIDVGGAEIDAGELLIHAGETLTVAADLRADSSLSDGGSIDLAGCAVVVESGVAVDSSGFFCSPDSAFDAGCRIDIAASGSMSLLGDFTAGAAGAADLSYRDATRPPDIASALFDVVPTLIEDPALPVCDSDGDTFDDDADNCALIPNPLQFDFDLDGAGDLCDNCVELANGPLLPDTGGNVQLDTDDDGYGGVCDCDFNNDGMCNIGDFNLFLSDFTAGVDSGIGTDMDGTAGVVGIGDFNLFLSGFTEGAPGPSAVAP